MIEHLFYITLYNKIKIYAITSSCHKVEKAFTFIL